MSTFLLLSGKKGVKKSQQQSCNNCQKKKTWLVIPRMKHPVKLREMNGNKVEVPQAKVLTAFGKLLLL